MSCLQGPFVCLSERIKLSVRLFTKLSGQKGDAYHLRHVCRNGPVYVKEDRVQDATVKVSASHQLLLSKLVCLELVECHGLPSGATRPSPARFWPNVSLHPIPRPWGLTEEP